MAQGYGYATSGRYTQYGEGNYIPADNGSTANQLGIGAPDNSTVTITEPNGGMGHRHVLTQTNHSHKLPDYTGSVGSGTAFNIIPTYQAVYTWYRVS